MLSPIHLTSNTAVRNKTVMDKAHCKVLYEWKDYYGVSLKVHIKLLTCYVSPKTSKLGQSHRASQ